MKKTVTTILSFALALILVSSLSSGVILAKGDDDHDNREKNKNKFHTVHDVAIMECGLNPNLIFEMSSVVTLFQASTTENVPGMAVFPAELDNPTICPEGIALMLNHSFKLEKWGNAIDDGFGGLVVRYTFLRKRRELRD